MQFEIRKVITGYAYPKNGNLHNPTPRVAYFVYQDDRLIGIDYRLRDAKQFIADIEAGVYAD
jgi:hypothetical protein